MGMRRAGGSAVWGGAAVGGRDHRPGEDTRGSDAGAGGLLAESGGAEVQCGRDSDLSLLWSLRTPPPPVNTAQIIQNNRLSLVPSWLTDVNRPRWTARIVCWLFVWCLNCTWVDGVTTPCLSHME